MRRHDNYVLFDVTAKMSFVPNDVTDALSSQFDVVHTFQLDAFPFRFGMLKDSRKGPRFQFRY